MTEITSKLHYLFRLGPVLRKALGLVAVGPALRISLGLSALLVTCLMGLDFAFSVLPDQSVLQRQLRERISESLALQCAHALESGDTKLLVKTLRQATARDAQMRSIAVRRSDGHVVAQSGNHAQHWVPPAEGLSDLDHVRVPLFMAGSTWGAVEISFQSMTPKTAWEWLREPNVFLVVVLTLCAVVVFSLYLRRVLSYLDPSSVIPDRVRMAFDGFSEGVIIVDPRGRIVLANAVFRRWVERSNVRLYGQPIQNIPSLKSALPNDPTHYPWMLAMAQGKTLKGEQLDIPQERGDEIRTAVNCAPIQDAGSMVRGCIVTFDNVTEIERTNRQLREAIAELEISRQQIERQNEELQTLAMRDQLTGCLNRHALFDRLDPLFASARATGMQLSCIMVDVDHFKAFNDRFGHAVGDQVLKVVTRNLSGGLREPDLLARYGGEEFCIILPETRLEQACLIAERLRAEVHSRAGKGIRSTQGLTVSASFGISSLRPDITDPAALIDRADKALYEAKAAGRNCVRAAPDVQAAAAS